MQLRKTILASVFSAALALSAAACGTAENTQSVCSAAASEHVAETPTPSPEGEGWGISSTLLYAACPATYYTSIGCSCTPRRAASSVSGSRVKSLFRLRGFL